MTPDPDPAIASLPEFAPTPAAGQAPRIVFAGIDEAGLGPLLGPLVIGASAFSVPAERVPADAAALDLPGQIDFWKLLGAQIADSPRYSGPKAIICDSKLLHTPKSIKPLEETVLAVAAAMAGTPGAVPATMREFLDAFSLLPSAKFAGSPWFSSARLDGLTLPAEALKEKCAIRGMSLAADWKGLGVRLEGVRVRPVLEPEFNALLDRFGNKAEAHFYVIASVIHKLWSRFPNVRVVVDKQGGRDFYGGLLERAFPQATASAVAEAKVLPDVPLPAGMKAPKTKPKPAATPASAGNKGQPRRHDDDDEGPPKYSHYRLRDGARELDVMFVQEGERRSMLVALASVFAKYTRECCMEVFNRYWLERVPGLKPTKGYYLDGKRFLADVEKAGLADYASVKPLMVRNK